MQVRSRVARLERKVLPDAGAVAGWLTLVRLVDELMPRIDVAYVRREEGEMLVEAQQWAGTGKRAGVGFEGIMALAREGEEAGLTAWTGSDPCVTERTEESA